MKNRQYGVDIAKIVGSALVIAVHHFNTIGFYEVIYNGGGTMYLATAMYNIALACVPIFLISTGYLLSERKIELSHYKKVVYFLIEVFILYFILFGLKAVQSGNLSLVAIAKQAIGKFFSPAYYVGLYFSLYMVSPFLNKFFHALNKNEKKWFMGMLVLTISLPQTLNTLFNITFFDNRPTALWSVFYYFVGLCIRYFQPKISKINNIIYLVVTSAIYSFLINKLLIGQQFSHVLGYYQNIFVAISSALIFIFWYDLDIESRFLRKMLPVLSSMTMTFYLGGGMYSDPKALESITLTNTLLYNLPTIIPRVLLSMMYSIPIGLFVHIIMKTVYKKTKHLL